jgi:hypothetical protein
MFAVAKTESALVKAEPALVKKKAVIASTTRSVAPKQEAIQRKRCLFWIASALRAWK